MAVEALIPLVSLIFIFTLLAIGMNVKYGHTGLLDFGHVAFFLVGAYTAALVVLPSNPPNDYTTYLVGLNLPVVLEGIVPFGELLGWLVAMVVAMVVAGTLGGLVALPTIRLREDYLAITLLGVSAILQRIIQAESWLVNGPDALRGYGQPLKSLFPLAAGDLPAAVTFGALVFVLWFATAEFLYRFTVSTSDTPGGSAADGLQTDVTFGHGRPPRRAPRVTHRLQTVVTIGLARRWGDEPSEQERILSSAAGGVAVGVVGFLATLVGLEAMLVVSVVVSAVTWGIALVAVRQYTEAFDVTDYLASLGLAVAFMASLLPLTIVGGFVGSALAPVAGATVAFVTIYLSRNWEPFEAKRLQFGAAIGLWFVVLWYFVLPIGGPLFRADLLGVVSTTIASIVWTLDFTGRTITIDYGRFMLVVFGVITFVGYYGMKLAVASPFGRILRSIRNDEQVVTSLGKDPFNYKLQSMVLGSALAGLAGALAAMFYQALVFTQFGPRITFVALLMVFLGGVGNNRAMVVGAAVFWAFQSASTQIAAIYPPAYRERIQAFRLVVLGLMFLLVLYYRPQGMFGREQFTDLEAE